MQAVNLLPLELRPGPRWQTIGRRAEPRRVLGIAGIAAGVIALALAGATLWQRGVVEDRRDELAGVQARLVAAEAKASAIREAQASNQARLTAVRDLVARRIVWEDVLRDLSRVLPENVVLQSLLVGGGSAGAVAAGSPFTITGTADSQVRVAQVLERLNLLPWLGGVTLQSSASAAGPRSPVSFTVAAVFNASGGGR